MAPRKGAFGVAENMEEEKSMSDTESVMCAMRREFMPRETLNITFDHIEKKLSKIEDNLKSLPRDLADEFESRFGDRIKALEQKVEKLEAFYLKAMGGLAVIIALAKAAEHFLKQ